MIIEVVFYKGTWEADWDAQFTLYPTGRWKVVDGELFIEHQPEPEWIHEYNIVIKEQK